MYAGILSHIISCWNQSRWNLGKAMGSAQRSISTWTTGISGTANREQNNYPMPYGVLMAYISGGLFKHKGIDSSWVDMAQPCSADGELQPQSSAPLGQGNSPLLPDAWGFPSARPHICIGRSRRPLSVLPFSVISGMLNIYVVSTARAQYLLLFTRTRIPSHVLIWSLLESLCKLPVKILSSIYLYIHWPIHRDLSHLGHLPSRPILGGLHFSSQANGYQEK